MNMNVLGKVLNSSKAQRSWLAVVGVLIGAAISSQICEVSYSLTFYSCITACLVKLTYDFLKNIGNYMSKSQDQIKDKSKKSLSELLYYIIPTSFFSAFFLIICLIKAKIGFIESVFSFLLFIVPLVGLALYAKKNSRWSYNRIVETFLVVFYIYISVCMSLYLQSKTINYAGLLFGTAYALMNACILNIYSIKNVDRDIDQGNKTISSIIGRNYSLLLQIVKISFAHLLLLFWFFSQKDYIYSLIIFVLMIGALGSHIRLVWNSEDDYKYVLKDQILSTLALGITIISKYFFI